VKEENKMIEALKQALKALEGFIPYLPLKDEAQCNRYDKAITSLRQAIAELESQEPVGEVDAIGLNDTDFHVSFKKPMPLGTKLYTHPPQRTEPQIKTTDPFESAKVEDYNRGWNDCIFASGIVKQSQRTWQGLTDEEVKHEWEVWRANVPRYAGFAKGIEAKLKEKNT
jgi:hypothetical protein